MSDGELLGRIVGCVSVCVVLFLVGTAIGFHGGKEEGAKLIEPAPMDAVDWKKIAPITMDGFYVVAAYDDVCYIHVDVGGSDE